MQDISIKSETGRGAQNRGNLRRGGGSVSSGTKQRKGSAPTTPIKDVRKVSSTRLRGSYLDSRRRPRMFLHRHHHRRNMALLMRAMHVRQAIGDEGCTLEECRRMIEGVNRNGDEIVEEGVQHACLKDTKERQESTTLWQSQPRDLYSRSLPGLLLAI